MTPRAPDAVVISRPSLDVRDADREAVADALADLLLAALTLDLEQYPHLNTSLSSSTGAATLSELDRRPT